MKAMKIKFVITAMTTMVAFSATACELKLSGDTKQIESAIDSYVDKVNVVVDNGAGDQTDATVLDASRDTASEATESQDMILPSEAPSETTPDVAVPTQKEAPAPTEKTQPKETKTPKATEPKQTQAPKETEAPKQTQAPVETQPKVTEPQVQETEAPETTPSETYPEIPTSCNDPLAPRWVYKDIIDPNLDVYGKVIKYSLMHLDGDEIPELVIYDKTN